jgi:hypothetical protein
MSIPRRFTLPPSYRDTTNAKANMLWLVYWNHRSYAVEMMTKRSDVGK